jgi:hypothetical protein
LARLGIVTARLGRGRRWHGSASSRFGIVAARLGRGSTLLSRFGTVAAGVVGAARHRRGSALLARLGIVAAGIVVAARHGPARQRNRVRAGQFWFQASSCTTGALRPKSRAL